MEVPLAVIAAGGFCHAQCGLLSAGDVLLLFSIVGVVLFVVRRLNDRTVLILALLFLLQPVEWYNCFRALVDTGFAPPDLGVLRGHVRRGCGLYEGR